MTPKTKIKAHNMVRVALKRGLLVRQPCEVCGAGRVDAHHEDYRFSLKVQWLCRSCHLRGHAAERAKPPEPPEPPVAEWLYNWRSYPRRDCRET